MQVACILRVYFVNDAADGGMSDSVLATWLLCTWSTELLISCTLETHLSHLASYCTCWGFLYVDGQPGTVKALSLVVPPSRDPWVVISG